MHPITRLLLALATALWLFLFINAILDEKSALSVLLRGLAAAGFLAALLFAPSYRGRGK